MTSGEGDDRWWTFAGLLANAELAARLGNDTAPESLWLRVPAGTSAADLRALGSVVPARPSQLMARMAANLKFAQCLLRPSAPAPLGPA